MKYPPLYKLLLILVFVLSQVIVAQIQPSVTNYFRYGNGSQFISGSKNKFIYRENLTDAKFRIPYNFSVGVRFLYDNPPEVGQSFTGISRRFLEYSKDDLSIRVGNFSELYGKGLALNLFEDRGLAYDTWADGLKAHYKLNDLEFSMLYGKIEYKDSINIWRQEDYTLVGGNVEYKLNDFVKLGASYIDAEGTFAGNDEIAAIRAEVPELYLDLGYSDFNLYVDWSQKWTSIIGGESSIGNGLYSSLSFSTSGFGIVLDYKNYKFDQRDPFSRDDYSRSSRMLPFQNPPIVMKEHSYVFLSRSIHEVDFNDEVGLQVEVFYTPIDDTYLNFNASLSSRHNYYNYNQDNFEFTLAQRDNNYLPSTDDEYSPFWEYFMEAEHYFSPYTSLNIGFARRSKSLYSDFVGQTGTHKILSTVIPFLLQHTFNEVISSQLQYEFEAVSDNYATSQPEFNNHFISLLANLYSKLSLNVRYEFTTTDFDPSGRKDWYTIEAGYRINPSNNLTVSYGRERGGQICSNGVCRYVLPFEGFKVSLLSSF